MKEKIINWFKENWFKVGILLVIFLVVVLGAYYGIKAYNSYKIGQATKDAVTQALITSQQQALQDAQKKIDNLKTQSEQNKIALQNKTKSAPNNTNNGAQNNISNNIQNNSNNQIVTKELSTADIVAEWNKRAMRVECYWTGADGVVYGQQGSATLVNKTGYGIAAVTNKHVIFNLNVPYVPPDNCIVGTYDAARNISTKINGSYSLGLSEDYGYIYLSAPYQLNNSDSGAFDAIVANHLNVCTKDPNPGDKVVILGYPVIGTSEGITVTSGIISGIEQDYYVTDAKIDHGNSGGTAILVKDDCWLGMPTWADNSALHGAFGFESLGRILKASFVLSN